MRKLCFASTLILLLLVGNRAHTQDFSNKGKEFWLAYSYHVGMLGGGAPEMTLYITSDVATTYTVEIYGLTTITTGNLAAGQVVPINISNAYFINNEGLFTNRTIRVSAPKPIVVYSYITRSAASGATLCLPTNVLGKEYYSMNFTQVSNENNSNSFITIIAVEDNTAVEITPTANTKNGWLANTTYTVNLNKGQIYQVLGATGGFNGEDLTGSKIRSVASGTGGCKKIAVFSGSGKIRIPATGCANNSSDNLYQQLYPTGTWGKKYITVPSLNNPNNYYRISRSDPAANVSVNGSPIPATSFTNNYYQFFNNRPNVIESDLPISVAQFFTTQGCDQNSNFNPYDPDMIMLNPVEQNIDSVTLVSSNLVAGSSAQYPHQHHIHAIMRNGGTGTSSFRLDGNPVPASSWVVHPNDPGYSYLYMNNVSQGYHTLSADSGFNAIAYGYANAESYGYSAGANVKDLYQFVTVANQNASVNFAGACTGIASSLSMTFPYQPTQIVWEFNGLFPDVTINNPVFNSSSVVNGRTLYKYNLPGTYTVPTAGAYPIRIVAQNPTADGCNGIQEIEIEFKVFDPPTAGFNFVTNGCVSSPVNFTDNSTNTSGRDITSWYWDFGDNTNATVVPTTHTYAAPGTYTVNYSVMTDMGCASDTFPRTVVLNDPPLAQFTPQSPYCAGKTITFKDNSTVLTGSITKWKWDFGDGSPVVNATTNADQTHTYANAGPYTVTLQVESASGCLSLVTSTPITVRPNPVVAFNLPSVCLPAGAAQFNSTSTISDGTESQFTYLWNFGDGSPAGVGQNPIHNYTTAGPFPVALTVTSNNGCATTLNQNLTTIFAEPKAIISAPPEVCIGSAINFTDQSTAAGSSVNQWQWDFGDGSPLSTVQNPSKTYATAGTYTVTLRVTSAVGCQSVTPANVASHTVVVNALPVAGFNISNPACVGQGVTFSNASTPNAGTITKWTWTFGDATNAVLTNGNPFVHTYPVVNSYNVTLQVETDKGCVSAVLPRSITINPVPKAGFIAPEICVGDNLAPFTDTSYGTATAWEWNFGDANANAGNPNTSTLQHPTHHYTLPGNYTAQLVAINAAGCRDTVRNPVSVNGALLTPRFTVENIDPLCSNKSITIKDGSTIDAGNIIRVEIYWDGADLTNRTTDNDPLPGETYTHTYPEFGTPATRSYTVRYEVWSGITCVSSFTRDITMLATPQLAFGSILPVCSNVPPFQVTQALLTNILPGTGTFAGTGVTPTGLFDPQLAGAGQHPVTYTYVANNGCISTATQAFIVDPTPVANAGPDKFVLEGGFITLTPSLIANIPVTYSWSPGTWLNDPTIPNVQASPPTDFTYTLTVTSDKGCTDDDEVLVTLLKSLVIPNIFSPNGDNINDKWVIEHLDSYPGCVIQLYNRYGQLIQRFVNYTPWDGRINGKDAPIGTYYYIIDPKNGRKPMTGFVDIIR
ncbi:MAG: PKD domain-containing protein [Chitinophagaceae bacterium]|nr:PKD domain-containing protein [Chitinophagaceae bacterium]